MMRNRKPRPTLDPAAAAGPLAAGDPADAANPIDGGETGPDGSDSAGSENILRIRKAGKRFRRGWALRELTLTVRRGSITALLGPTAPARRRCSGPLPGWWS